jgi:beta-lactamase regulating signal transducer with metallopeptidase domain
MIPVLVEAALRALLVAVTVWAGLGIFRVSNVLAQKIAWALVLASAVAMPLVMRWHIRTSSMALDIPIIGWNINSALPVRQALLPGSHAENPVVTQSALTSAANRPPAPIASTPFPSSPAPSSLDGSRASRFPAPVISRTEFDTSPGARIAVAPSVTTQSADPLTPATSYLNNSAFSRAGEWVATSGLLRWGTWAAFLYLGVVLVLMIRMVYGVSQALRLWHSAEPFVPMPAPDASLDRTSGREIRFSARIASPVTIGSGILLPAECLDWDREKLRIVLAHESAHVRQMDFYLQLLASLYAAAFWFSPLGWWLRHKLSDLGEAISDRAGLEEAASRASYAQLLLEFAAMPRPTAPAVAMARSSNLSHRIERLLNETNFRQAFAGSRARLLLAVLLVPAACLAATTLIRVQAAQTGTTAPPALLRAAAPSPAPAPAPSPDAIPDQTLLRAEAPAPGAQSDRVAPVTRVAPLAPVTPVAAIAPVAASDGPNREIIHDAFDNLDMTLSNGQQSSASIGSGSPTITLSDGKSGSVRYYSADSNNGDSWALVRDGRDHVAFSGEWNDQTKGSIDRARKLAKGQQFLWFMRDSKPYIVDDPAVIAQIEALYKPIEELGRQQEVLGKQQEELGRQQEALGRRQEQASIPTPDISKEMAQLNEAVAKLNAQKGSTVSQEQLADLEGKLGDLQGRLGALQGEVGAKQGELGAEQGRLGEKQGKLGEEQGRLGEQQGKLADDANRMVRAIINQSLDERKAQPVE